MGLVDVRGLVNSMVESAQKQILFNGLNGMNTVVAYQRGVFSDVVHEVCNVLSSIVPVTDSFCLDHYCYELSRQTVRDMLCRLNEMGYNAVVVVVLTAQGDTFCVDCI